MNWARNLLIVIGIGVGIGVIDWALTMMTQARAKALVETITTEPRIRLIEKTRVGGIDYDVVGIPDPSTPGIEIVCIVAHSSPGLGFHCPSNAYVISQ